MAKTVKRKRISKPKEPQTIDGLGVSFEDAMKLLSQPENKENKPKKS
jgi:hypothetical protein